jgi:hypothetical protein
MASERRADQARKAAEQAAAWLEAERAETLFKADDAGMELRPLSGHRDNLVVDRTRLTNPLHAQMLQLDPCYVERSGPLTRAAGARCCQDLRLPEGAIPKNRATLYRMRVLHEIEQGNLPVEAVPGVVRQSFELFHFSERGIQLEGR